ncbi:MAG: hypothetical protein OXU79_02560 [Gemmatimonadota bacterium]|nr:hypothetical protein [Gemmatimonadota bacterium]
MKTSGREVAVAAAVPATQDLPRERPSGFAGRTPDRFSDTPAGPMKKGLRCIHRKPVNFSNLKWWAILDSNQ